MFRVTNTCMWVHMMSFLYLWFLQWVWRPSGIWWCQTLPLWEECAPFLCWHLAVIIPGSFLWKQQSPASWFLPKHNIRHMMWIFLWFSLNPAFKKAFCDISFMYFLTMRKLCFTLSPSTYWVKHHDRINSKDYTNTRKYT